jgi:hypothetical protein
MLYSRSYLAIAVAISSIVSELNRKGSQSHPPLSAFASDRHHDSSCRPKSRIERSIQNNNNMAIGLSSLLPTLGYSRPSIIFRLGLIASTYEESFEPFEEPRSIGRRFWALVVSIRQVSFWTKPRNLTELVFRWLILCFLLIGIYRASVSGQQTSRTICHRAERYDWVIYSF